MLKTVIKWKKAKKKKNWKMRNIKNCKKIEAMDDK